MLESVSLGVLFPYLRYIADSKLLGEAEIIKQNPIIDNVASFSELVDAFWWCVYGYAYTNKNEYYISNEKLLLDDMRCLVKCEMLRMSNKKHRFPTTHPRRRGRKANDAQQHLIKQYENLLEELCQVLNETCESQEKHISPLDMLTKLKNKQECMLGYSWENIKSVRKSQYNNIANLLDSIFIHRKYISRNQEEGGELLTPEEANEWDDAQKQIASICKEESTPFFIKNLVKMKSVMLLV